MQLHKSEILIIVAIIAASYIFSMNEVKFLDTQLMFILITLGIVIMYKLMYIQKMKNIEENFSVSIRNSGLSEVTKQNINQNSNFISKDDYDELENKLNKLQEEIGNMYQRTGVSEKKNSIKELIHDSDKVDKKIKERSEEIEELKAMLVLKHNENRDTHKKIRYQDSSTVDLGNSDPFSSTNRNGTATTNSINVRSSFKNMVSDADGGITEFKNTGNNAPSSQTISKSGMENTAGNAGNKQNKSQIGQLINHIKKNGVSISM
jgi:hypothetical protein